MRQHMPINLWLAVSLKQRGLCAGLYRPGGFPGKFFCDGYLEVERTFDVLGPGLTGSIFVTSSYTRKCVFLDPLIRGSACFWTLLEEVQDLASS